MTLVPVPGAEADGPQTGVLSGVVVDASGIRLQGVVVEAEGPRSRRQAVTDAAGRYRFPALEVGGWTLRATLLDLAAEARDVAVFAGRIREVELVLRPAAEAVAQPPIEDWIKVIADAPVIDRFETGVGATIPFELIDELPVERFYQSVALLLPGVAGGEDGNPNVSGALRSSNLYLVDGVDTSDPTTGLFGLNLNYEAIQEVQVTTAAAGAEFGRVSGAVINVVTRSGDNRFRGGVRWITGGSGRDDYRPGDDRGHLRRGIEAANRESGNGDATVSLALGGPVARDRLWAFAAFQDSSSSFLRPTLLGGDWDQDSGVEASAFKLTWQPDRRQTVVGQLARDTAEFASFNPFSSGPSELQLPQVPGDVTLQNRLFQPLPGEPFSLEDNRQDGRFVKLEWSLAASQTLSFGLTLAEQERELERGARNRRGLTFDAPHVGALIDPAVAPQDAGEDQLLLFLFNGVTEEGYERRPRQQANLVADALLVRGAVEHELRAGLDYQETESASRFNVAGSDGPDRLLGVPVSGQMFIDFDLRPECFFLGRCLPFDPETGDFQPVSLFNFWSRPERRTREQTLALHLSDTLVLKRLVISLGVRLEQVRGEDQAGRALVDDFDVSPRLALTYVPPGSDDSLISFAWGVYVEPFLHQYLDAYGQLDPLSGFTEYERLDTVEGLDCRLVDPADLASPCWRPVGATSDFPLLPAVPRTGLDRSRVSEWVVGYERRLSENLGLSLHWVDRRWSDLWNGLGIFDPATQQVFAEVRNLSFAERTYRALQVLVQKRFSGNWQMLASYTWSEAEGNLFRSDGLGTLGDFGQFVDTNLVNRRGPAPYDRPHQLGLFASRRWPLGRSQLTLGAAARYRDGVPFQFERLEDVGVRFLGPRGSERLGSSLQLDLALTWDWRLASRLDLELKVEAFNIFDQQETLEVETLVDTGLAGLPRTVDDVQAPRSVRFTLGIRF